MPQQQIAATGLKAGHPPQQKALPVVLRPHVWYPPALICAKTVLLDTRVGVFLSVVVPSPSWRLSFLPAGQSGMHTSLVSSAAQQAASHVNSMHYTSRSPQHQARPVVLSMPHVWLYPALICVKTVVPNTLTGVVENPPVVPFPSWPLVFSPAG